ncbi:MAG: 5,10-methylenetetrahydrofolate reductase [Flavobacteriia bacterium]|nr:MAG: 5,10-methylenetetrahydrofolate reductase [Flavobacteriia bacterium]
MKVTDHIKQAKGKTLFSFEVLPPMKGNSIEQLYETIDSLMEFDPAFIDVTAHREEFVLKDRGNGLLEKVTTRKRPGTVGICAAIQYKYKIDTVPHIICGGFTKEETEYALIDLNFLGIHNVLVLRGDAIRSEGVFRPEPNGHAYASELLEHVMDLNRGVYLHDEVKNNQEMDFCIGAAAYPEKHYEAPNLKTDIHWLKKKVEAGAEYVVTQMFFDNAKYFDFVDRCRKEGIDIPIIPGLKPLTSMKQLSGIPHFFHIDFPEELTDLASKCRSNDEMKELGTQWCIRQSKELKEAGVPALHYYSMGKAAAVKAVASEVF